MLTILAVRADEQCSVFETLAGQKAIAEVLRTQVSYALLCKTATASLQVGNPVNRQVASRIWDQIRENMGEPWGGQ